MARKDKKDKQDKHVATREMKGKYDDQRTLKGRSFVPEVY